MSDAKSDAPAPKKGKKGIIVIALAAVLLLGGGGGAAWYFLKPTGDDDGAAEVQPDKKKRAYATLEPFTVNLADDGNERFIQVSIVLEIVDSKYNAELTAHMPAVRNAVLMLLSSKESKDVLPVAGKHKLADEIAIAVGEQLGWESDEPRPRKTAAAGAKAERAEDDDEKPVRRKKSRRAPPNPIEAVHFVQFIVQ